MDWTAATWWWIVTGALIAAEMTTGTFYLLMLALGAAAAALCAHAGLGFSSQMITAALVGGGAVAAWHFRRQRHPTGVSAGADRNVNLDIGERVHVESWRADGSANIVYRGAQWSARFADDGVPEPGEFVIRGLDGNRLLLGR